MHEKRFKIDFFANFRKLQKKLPICKKRYAEILNVARAVVTSVEKKSNRHNRIFFTSAKVHPDCRRLSIFIHFMDKNVRDKSEKWETFFVAIVSKSKIGNKFRPPKSSMGSLFQARSSKNQSFFRKECRIPPIGVPQQHHLSQQHFGGHVA